MHSLAPKMGTSSFYQDCYALGEMETVGRGCRMRPEGPKIEDEGAMDIVLYFSRRGQQAPPARGSGSDVNMTKFLRPRPKQPEVNKRHLADLTFK